LGGCSRSSHSSRRRSTLDFRSRANRPDVPAPERPRGVDMADRTVALRSLVFDSLEEQVALVDHAGTIVDVNASWTRFGHENAAAVNACGIGADYLAVVRR